MLSMCSPRSEACSPKTQLAVAHTALRAATDIASDEGSKLGGASRPLSGDRGSRILYNYMADGRKTRR